MLNVARVFGFAIIALLVVLSGVESFAAEASAEQLYAILAKLPADQREKQLEEGARKEGKLNLAGQDRPRPRQSLRKTLSICES
jgi:hypothetical protein